MNIFFIILTCAIVYTTFVYHIYEHAFLPKLRNWSYIL